MKTQQVRSFVCGLCAVIFTLAFTALSLTGCPDGDNGNNGGDGNGDNNSGGGGGNGDNSTTITYEFYYYGDQIWFYFSASVTDLNLTANDITVSGAASKGSAALTVRNTTASLPVTVNADGTARVRITKNGIESGTKTVEVYKSTNNGNSEQYFTVTFDLDGGNISGSTASVQRTVKSGETVTSLPNPQKANNTFGGWFTAKNGGGTQFTAITEVTAHLTVYAKWTSTSNSEQYFTVTFDLDGGNISGSTASVQRTVKSGETVTSLPNPQKANNTFGGWFTAKNGGGTQFTAITKVTAHLTVYAKWTSTSSNIGDPNNTLYIAGSYQNTTDTRMACFWKDGTRTDLPAPDGHATDIAVTSNGDVYIAGYYQDTTDTRMACYWKDGTRTDLPVPDGIRISYASDIAVSSNGDVYIRGSYQNTTDTDTRPCYWKNGVITSLSVGNSISTYARGIAVSSNGDVYIAGRYQMPSSKSYNAVACYWKNGTRTDLSTALSSGSKYDEAYDIAVSSNGDVYVLGRYAAEPSDVNLLIGISYNCYWRNGARVSLGIIETSVVSTIAVTSNGDVYIAGRYSYDLLDEDRDVWACYWKNGTRTDLRVPNGTRRSSASRIAVTSNGDVYILGYYEIDDERTQCYWKNGVRTELHLPAGSGANRILMVPR